MATRSAAYEQYKDDWQYHDGIEDVTLRVPPGYSTAQADYGPIKAKEEIEKKPPLKRLGDAAIKPRVTSFVLWAVDLEGDPDEDDVVPQEGFKIVRADESVWTITEVVGKNLFDTQYLVNCKKDL